MPTLNLKPTHKPIKSYYAAIDQFAQIGVTHETAVRAAFQDLIPSEVFDYRLGNRSALEWVIDQYRVKTDKRSGIFNDPNRAHDPQYILRLIDKVISVSLEMVKNVTGLLGLGVEGVGKGWARNSGCEKRDTWHVDSNALDLRQAPFTDETAGM